MVRRSERGDRHGEFDLVAGRIRKIDEAIAPSSSFSHSDACRRRRKSLAIDLGRLLILRREDADLSAEIQRGSIEEVGIGASLEECAISSYICMVEQI